ncbi:MAG TPA: hypothetical protein PLK55_01390 [archaeon]|nr:hypothetical protein [archaeon]
MKTEKTKWYFLIAVALIVGAIVGYLATTKFSTTGDAKIGISDSCVNEVDLLRDDASARCYCSVGTCTCGGDCPYAPNGTEKCNWTKKQYYKYVTDELSKK